ncbi:hypothetical protein EC968_002803 [Mortierella alpina]|nr:hypothetical protein EC968_002803 [Mortierella alpina]
MGNSSSATADSMEPTALASLVLGRPPADWDYSSDARLHSAISEPILEKIEPVGPQYLAHARRKIYKRTFSEDEEHLAKAEAEAAAAAQLAEDAENVHEFEIEPDHKDDLRRDAKDWKSQDHYRLLGLGSIRWRATRGMIKKAHRTKVLVHHPDKKSAASGGNATHDDSFFKCLQKAYEVLSDPIKRRQYDSVDPIPEESYNALKDGADLPFIEAWKPVFEREARFSVRDKKDIPSIGTMDSSKKEVEAFYGFWYGFDSWRTFEYLDKEEGDGPENRDEKRYMEKKNKAERAKLKKEDAARLRKLVDTAFALDPRMAIFKEQEKEGKEARRQERLDQAKKAKLEAEREAALAKELEEEKESEERLKREEERKEKESKKKTIRKEKKSIKTLIKDANYGHKAGTHIAPSALEIYLSELDTMLDKLTLEDLERISKELGAAKTSNETKQKILCAEAQKLVRAGLANSENLTQFDTDTVERSAKVATEVKAPSASSTSATSSSNTASKEWSVEEVALLIKAANKFPGGVSDRWETIAAYVALHTGLPQRDPEDVIKKSKSVQRGTSQEQETVRQLQFHKKTYDIADAPSVRYDIEGEVPPVVAEAVPVKDAVAAAMKVASGKKQTKKAGVKDAPATSATSKTTKATDTVAAALPSSSSPSKASTSSGAGATSPASSGKTPALAAATAPTPAGTAAAPAAALWTAAEQKLLEGGMKAFPPSWQGEGDRWDKIAEAVPGRTKKDCKLRVKYLQEQVKAQKAAAAAASGK